jgi:hypothetical protein
MGPSEGQRALERQGGKDWLNSFAEIMQVHSTVCHISREIFGIFLPA